MPSQYSPDLRIELIGTGDQAGVWGATTNNNLAYVLEQAIAGYVSVPVTSTAQVLTYINGASTTAADNQSVHAALALTASGVAADFFLYIPPNSKLYVIYNNTGYTAKVRNSYPNIGDAATNGTGVDIPTGKVMAVWSDGTNVSQQSDNFISPALTGTPTAPTATFGTNTTQVATTAFVQAAMQALHPVGSIYTSTSSTNPGTAFGFGTWVAYGAGRVLIGNGGGYSAGATGGSADAIVVSHTHTATSSFSGSTGFSSYSGANHTHNLSFASGTESLHHSHAITINDPGHYHTIPLARSDVNYATGFGSGTVTGSGYSTASSTTNITASSGIESSSHTHYISGVSETASADHYHTFTPSGSVSTTVASSGSSGTGANLQPYVVVYMWNRTA